MTDGAWRGADGEPIACREKLRMLDENYREAAQVLQDAFEDAVLMGVDEQAMRETLAGLVAGLRSPQTRGVRLAVAALLLGVAAPAWAQAPEGWVARGTADLILLDKIRAQPQQAAVRVGASTVFGSLTIKLTACFSRPPDQPADSTAFVEVSDARGTEGVFRGWILANTPSVSQLQHPVYDLRLAGCR